jgi:hypothetical protein
MTGTAPARGSASVGGAFGQRYAPTCTQGTSASTTTPVRRSSLNGGTHSKRVSLSERGAGASSGRRVPQVTPATSTTR